MKLFQFVQRRPDLDHEAFVEGWSGAHAETVMGAPAFCDGLGRYVHNHAVMEPDIPVFPVSRFDGVAECWFSDRDALLAALASPDYTQTILPSLARYADPQTTITVAATEALQFDHGWGDLKFIGLSRRHPSMTHDQWCRYWVDVHGPLAYAVPEFARYYGKYAHNYIPHEPIGPLSAQHDYDGIVEEWLASVEAFAACLAEPRYLEIIQPDEQRFVDVQRSHFVFAHEHVIHDEGSE